MGIKIVDDEDSKRPLHNDERLGIVSGQAGRAQMAQKLAAGSLIFIMLSCICYFSNGYDYP